MNNLQEKIGEYRRKWVLDKKWVDPDLADCLDFMVTEVAEAVECRLRAKNYVRNNFQRGATYLDLGIEIFDAIMMGCIALDILGIDLDEVAQIKLEEMDRKRQVET